MQILQDVVTGLESDVEGRAMEVAASLGEAAGNFSRKIGCGIGEALGKIASGNFGLSDAVEEETCTYSAQYRKAELAEAYNRKAANETKGSANNSAMG